MADPTMHALGAHPSLERSEVPHQRAIVAGTFDRLHAGHFDLLDAAFRVGRHVEVHISDDAMVQAKARKLGQSMRTFAERCSHVTEWLDNRTCDAIRHDAGDSPKTIDVEPPSAPPAAEPRCFSSDARPYRGRYSLHELHDGMGDSIRDPTYTAIVCSAETKAGCDMINAKRAELGFPLLAIYTVPLHMAPGAAVKLSSTAIREAEAAAEARGPEPPRELKVPEPAAGGAGTGAVGAPSCC